MATDNKLVKTITDSAITIGLAAGIGYVAKKALKESFTGDPSSNVVNYAKWVVVLSSSTYLQDYLRKEKIIPA